MKPEELAQDTALVEKKVDELNSMLDIAKRSGSAQSVITSIESAIKLYKDCLKNIQRNAELQRKMPKHIVLRATHLDTWAKDRHCSGVYYPVDDHYVFELEQTKRWFANYKFLPRVGYLLIPDGSNCTYEITSVAFLDKRPKKTIFTAVPVKAA